MVKSNKYYVSIIISLVFGILLGLGTKLENKNQKSVKEAIKEYESLIISDKKIGIRKILLLLRS